jgi:hypothetical protein
MSNKDLLELLSEMKLEENILLEDIPDLDLYMDQVIQLFENKFSDTLRNDKDKVLTKTMINNYSKDKLFMQGKNKKYSKSHLILLGLIYQMKGSLSIGDIKNVLNPIVKSFDAGKEYPLEEVYSAYLELFKDDVCVFKENMADRMNAVNKIASEKELLSGDYENMFLTFMSLVTMSNLYRKAAERLLDDFLEK